MKSLLVEAQTLNTSEHIYYLKLVRLSSRSKSGLSSIHVNPDESQLCSTGAVSLLFGTNCCTTASSGSPTDGLRLMTQTHFSPVLCSSTFLCQTLLQMSCSEASRKIFKYLHQKESCTNELSNLRFVYIELKRILKHTIRLLCS